MKKLIIICLWVISISLGSNAQIITTIAGRDTLGYSGDNGLATAALIAGSYGIATDTFGNIYFTDGNNYRIRKVNTNGIITTIAGTGIFGHTGDGGPATAAKIGTTEGIAIDKNGNIYFTESDLNSVRKINTSGIITTIAGTGTFGTGYSGDGGQASAAILNWPTSVAFDMYNNLYITDHDNSVIRKIDITGIISTIAGSHISGSSGDGGAATNAELYLPIGIAIDTNNNIYIATEGRIRKVNNAGVISTFAGNGTPGSGGDGGMATDAEMEDPSGLTIDKYGNLLFTDLGISKIRVVDTAGIITTIAGIGTAGDSGDGGSPLSAELNGPTGICIFEDSLYFVDLYNSAIRKISGISKLSISKIKMDELNLYPNPCKGLFYLEIIWDTIKPASYEVTDILGRQIKTGVIKGQLTTIDIRNYEPNIYLLKIRIGNNVHIEKISLLK